jgi:hypothetical protein
MNVQMLLRNMFLYRCTGVKVPSAGYRGHGTQTGACDIAQEFAGVIWSR